jgi:uncharacterized protein (TIGR02271 family)
MRPGSSNGAERMSDNTKLSSAPDASVDVREHDQTKPELDRTVQLVEENLDIAKREIVTGTIRVVTRTVMADEIATIALDHGVVDVVRVPMDQKVDEAPAVRTDGETTIIPVIEERAVVLKQLYVVEEIHIRRRFEQESRRTSIPLRRQVATVERLDSEGRVTNQL